MSLRRSFASLFLLSSLTSAAFADDPIFLRRDATTLDPAIEAARVRLAGVAATSLRVVTEPETRRVIVIHDAGVAVAGDSGARLMTFFREHGALFGLPESAEVRPIPGSTFDDRATGDVFFLGKRIEDVLARARFEAEALEFASLRAPVSFLTTGGFLVSRESAIHSALEALGERRAAFGRSGALQPPIVEAVWLRGEAGLRATLRLDFYSVRPGEAWRVHVDGATGEVLRIQDRVRHQTKGNLPVDFDGSFITFAKFPLGDAKGRVFSSQTNAINGVSSSKTIKNFAVKGAPAAAVDKGFIFGRIANVFDFYGDDPVQPNMVFDFDPFGLDALGSGIPEYDAFDCVNIEYQLERFYAHLLKSLGKSALGSNLSMPVVVNSPETQINAFFSPSPFPDAMNPFTFGYLEFFDLTETTLDIADDVARDPVVACHEYTHAWLFYENLPFDDLLDFPPRAVGEAIPDFFGTTLHGNDDQVGRYLAVELTGGVPIRQLQDDDRFPETTMEAIYDQDPGPGTVLLPEEHINGEIYGSFLLDIRDSLGGKRTEKLVFDAMPGMPHTMDDVGFSANDVLADPFDATGEYFFECAFATLTESLSSKEVGVIYGAGLGRGVFANEGDRSLLLILENATDRKLVFPTVFPRSHGTSKIAFHAKQGRKLAVKIAKPPGSSLSLNFTLTASNLDPGAFTFNEAPTTLADGSLSQKNIVLNLPLGKQPQTGDPFYVLTVNASAGTGYYTITLDA